MAGNKNNFIVQGSILAISGILVRIIGLIYRVPLTNILGDVAMGYYDVAYSVYSLFLLFSSMSIPIAVSKLVSARVAKRQMKNAYRIFIGSLFFSVSLSFVTSLLMFFGAEKFAEISGYSEAKYAIMILAPTLFIMSILGVLRGYFQGIGSMIPTAFSQIIEQIVNAIGSITAAIYLVNLGRSADKLYDKSSAYGAAGGTMGTLLGAFSALLFMIFVFALYKKVLNRQMRRDKSTNLESYGSLVKLLTITILPVLMSTTIYNFSSVFDSFIYGNVMSSVFTVPEEVYSAAWGIYSNKCRVLTTVPISFASALSSAVIPSLVRTQKEGTIRQVRDKINLVIRFTMIIAIPAGVGLSFLSRPIIQLLFPNPASLDLGSSLLRFAFLIVVTFSFSTITNAILQGIDRMKTPIINSAISLGFHFVILFVLLVVFELDLYSIVIADFIYAFMICVLNVKSLKKYIGYRQELVKTFVLPSLAAFAMGVIALGLYKFMMLIVKSNAISTITAIGFAVIVYALLLLAFRVVDEKDLGDFPKGNLIISFAKKIRLM